MFIFYLWLPHIPHIHDSGLHVHSLYIHRAPWVLWQLLVSSVFRNNIWRVSFYTDCHYDWKRTASDIHILEIKYLPCICATRTTLISHFASPLWQHSHLPLVSLKLMNARFGCCCMYMHGCTLHWNTSVRVHVCFCQSIFYNIKY